MGPGSAESLHCPELGRPFGRARPPRGQYREPRLNLFWPIPDQRADLDKLWASPLKPPPSQRSDTDSQLPGNLIFGQKRRHHHLSAPLAWRQPVCCWLGARDRRCNVRFNASIFVLTNRFIRLTATPAAVEPVELVWGRCFGPMTVCTTFLPSLQKQLRIPARS